ncbi:MAG: hypothetical protein GY925_14530, partial [Actinomycetia bacterium]|nr:hypothetical protein [Actinomycetes bacterium]
MRTALAENGMAERGALVTDGTSWSVTITLEAPLTDADYDRPVKALPVPFDTLAPDIESISVAADSPMGNLGLDVAPNVGSLRQML